MVMLMLKTLPRLKIMLASMSILTLMVILILVQRVCCRLAMAGNEKSAIAAHDLLGRMQEQGMKTCGVVFQGKLVQTQDSSDSSV